MSPEFAGLLSEVTVLALPAIFAITFHEAAHGFIAHRCGDDTAWNMGRVTFNPLKHIDPIGTVLMPLFLFVASGGRFLFGYAKPVPVSFHKLNHPRRDMVYVALAGPATNVMLAIISALLMYTVPHLPGSFQEWTQRNLEYSVEINIILAVFNMIPLPPLGWRPGRGGNIAGFPGAAAGPAGAVRHPDPDRGAVPAADDRRSAWDRSQLRRLAWSKGRSTG